MRAVIFDLDGTLADTLGDIADAMNYVLAESSLPTHSDEDYRTWVGWGLQHLVDHALPLSARDQGREFAARFRRYYAEHLVVRTTPYPGVAELLDQLAGRYVLGVLSNKPQALTTTMVDALFSRWPFVDVVGARDDVPHKPDPTSAIALAQRLGFEAEQCVFVGDSEVDMETALRANMRAIGVDWGFRDRTTLSDAGAHAVLGQPADLMQFLED